MVMGWRSGTLGDHPIWACLRGYFCWRRNRGETTELPAASGFNGLHCALLHTHTPPPLPRLPPRTPDRLKGVNRAGWPATPCRHSSPGGATDGTTGRLSDIPVTSPALLAESVVGVPGVQEEMLIVGANP